MFSTGIGLGRPQYTPCCRVARNRSTNVYRLTPTKYRGKPPGPQSIEGVYNSARCFYPTPRRTAHTVRLPVRSSPKTGRSSMIGACR